MRFSFLVCDPITTLAELDRRMEFLASLGYRGVELSAFYPLNYPVEEVAELAERHRLPIVSMLSGWSYSHEGLCLCSPDPLVRSRAACRLGDYVAQSAAVGALLVVGLMQGLRSDEPDEAVARDRIVQELHRVAQIAQG